MGNKLKVTMLNGYLSFHDATQDPSSGVFLYPITKTDGSIATVTEMLEAAAEAAGERLPVLSPDAVVAILQIASVRPDDLIRLRHERIL